MAGFFGLFDFEKPGKGIEKDEREKRGFFLFWEIVGRRALSFVKINLMYFLCVFPLIFFVYLMYIQSTGQADISLFSILVSAFVASVPSWLFYGLLAVSCVLYGPATASVSYILRNYAKREHSWIAFDFYDQMRKNFKQALAAGLIDLLVVFLISTYFVNSNLIPDSWLYRTLIYAAIFVYFIMRFYTYTMIVTFNLNLFQIYKNAWMFVILGMKRNLIILLSLLLTILVFFALPGVGMLLDIVFFALFGLIFCGFIISFNTYPILKKYMIDPYYEQNPKEEAQSILAQDITVVDKPEEGTKDSDENTDDKKWLL